MNGTAEIKNYLHQMIVETNDLLVLEQIKEFFQSLKTAKDTPILESHKHIVRERLEEMKEGKEKTISWEQVKKDTNNKNGL